MIIVILYTHMVIYTYEIELDAIVGIHFTKIYINW